MSARVCERDGCEIEVTGRSKRCTEHQAEHRREAQRERMRQTRTSAHAGLCASKPVSPDDADREAKLRTALKRADIDEDLFDHINADPGAPFEHAAAFVKMRRETPPDWARVKAALKEAKVSIGDLERAMGTGEGGDGKPGRPLEFKDPEPWPEPVDGATLLDDLVTLLEHYASLPNGGAVAGALWALYTWVFRAFAVAPNLMITAPELGSGKTQLTDLISWIVPRPFPVSDTTAAAIFRIIEHEAPTLLFDEAQGILKRSNPDDPTKQILLGSFSKRFANVPRTNRDTGEVRMFSTFAPKALNGLRLAPIDKAFTSRCIVVPMTRATRAYPELRDDLDPVGEDVRRRCARWRDDHLSELREADPDMRGRIGRIAQVWRPLLAIADAAGGEWPEEARAAADTLAAVAGTFDSKETLGTMLLADVRAVFEAKGDPERIKSDDLDKALLALPERPWESMPKTGKRITAQARGRMLAGYGVNAETLRFEDGTRGKGYKREAFADAWNAYLPEGDGDRTVTPCQPYETSTFGDPRTVTTEPGCHGSRNAETPVNEALSRCHGSETGGSRREGAPEQSSNPPALPSQPSGEPTAGDAYRRRSDDE